MNSKTLLKCLCMCLAMFAILVNANAQDLKSILTGVAKAVVGDKATTSSSIIGTWKYVGPQCQFESENLLAKAGGEVAAKEVEEKMQTVYDRIGMSGCEYTFNEDGTYSFEFVRDGSKNDFGSLENSDITINLFTQNK